MRFNRSAPHARVVPVLTVSDVRAAVAWYGRIFGFVEHVKIGDGHRAQLGLPGGAPAELIVAEVRPGRRLPTADRSHQIMLKVEDVTGTLARAVASGASSNDEPRDHPYGERQAALTDPFGHEWVLTQTLADTAPEDWGGETGRRRDATSGDGLVSVRSAFSVRETVDRLASIVTEKGLTVFARVDHGANAAAVGLPLRPTELLIFGNPRAGTILMQEKQTSGIDLPVRALAWEDEAGVVWLTCEDAGWLARRHELGAPSAETVEAIRRGLAGVVAAATAHQTSDRSGGG